MHESLHAICVTRLRRPAAGAALSGPPVLQLARCPAREGGPRGTGPRARGPGGGGGGRGPRETPPVQPQTKRRGPRGRGAGLGAPSPRCGAPPASGAGARAGLRREGRARSAGRTRPNRGRWPPHKPARGAGRAPPPRSTPLPRPRRQAAPAPGRSHEAGVYLLGLDTGSPRPPASRSIARPGGRVLGSTGCGSRTAAGNAGAPPRRGESPPLAAGRPASAPAPRPRLGRGSTRAEETASGQGSLRPLPERPAFALPSCG